MRSSREYSGHVLLIITGRDLDPDAVSAALRLKPDRSWKRGQPKLPPVVMSPAKEGGWKLFSAKTSRSHYLEPQLKAWVGLLRTRRQAIRRLRARGYYCRLSWFADSSATVSVIIPNQLQRSLSELWLDWEISVWMDTQMPSNPSLERP
jgi:hypothetical protein